MTFLASFFAKQIEKRLPSRMKRMVVISSLSFLFSNKKRSLDDQVIHKLNRIMSLCHDHRAMKMPMALSRAIWHGREGMEIFDLSHLDLETASQIHERVDFILSKIPRCFRYAESSVMGEDIRLLMDHRTILMS